MAKRYCRRCDREKPTSRGGFCPYCMVYTETCSAEQSRTDMETYKKNPKNPHEKTKKLSENISRKTYSSEQSRIDTDTHEKGLIMLHKKTNELSEKIPRKKSLETPLTNEFRGNFICENCGKEFLNQKELEKHVSSIILNHIRFKLRT